MVPCFLCKAKNGRGVLQKIMALAEKLERAVEIKVPAEKFYEMCRSRPHHIASITKKIQTMKMHEGDRGVGGSTAVWHYTVDGKDQKAKEIIKTVDNENKLTSYKVTEGDLMHKYKSFELILQAVPKSNGGLLKWTIEYEKLSHDIPCPEKIMEHCIRLTKYIEEHLISA